MECSILYLLSIVPSQVILQKTIEKENRLSGVALKVAVQLNCKLGGEAWVLEMPVCFHSFLNLNMNSGNYSTPYGTYGYIVFLIIRAHSNICKWESLYFSWEKTIVKLTQILIISMYIFEYSLWLRRDTCYVIGKIKTFSMSTYIIYIVAWRMSSRVRLIIKNHLHFIIRTLQESFISLVSAFVALIAFILNFELNVRVNFCGEFDNRQLRTL